MLPPFIPGLLRGVYKNPKKYKKTYWTDYGNKIYFTSDAAYKDKNGLIRIVGRVDDVIKVAGHRVSTGELENIISKHPNVAECAVVGVAHEIKGEVPIVFMVRKGSITENKLGKELALKIREDMGPIAIPKQVYFVKDLPKTRSGKIVRRVFRKLFSGGPLGDLSTLANAECIEEIRNIIKEAKK
jgi:acetyl-CoA synthetase